MNARPENNNDELYSEEVVRLKAQLTEAQATIRSLNEKLDAALDGTGLCLWQGLPQTGDLTVFNLQAFKSGDMAPHFNRWCAKLHPEDRDATLKRYFDHLAGHSPRYEAEYRTLNQDGSVTWLWDLGRVVERDAFGRAVRVMGAHFDVTRRKMAEQEMARLAHFDPLTGLLNRRQGMERLNAAIESARHAGGELVIAMLDIDHFKLINDNYGHTVGDRILVGIGSNMASALRQGDACARWGGEEFVLVFPHSSIKLARQQAERIRHAISDYRESIEDGTIGVTASMGLAALTFGETSTGLLHRADQALLSAKRNGRDRIAIAK
jgi:diguanylate cyclase (GGDEF)-like protein